MAGAFDNEIGFQRQQVGQRRAQRMKADALHIGGQADGANNLKIGRTRSAELRDEFGNGAIADESDLHEIVLKNKNGGPVLSQPAPPLL